VSPIIADACALIEWYRGAARVSAGLERQFGYPRHGTLVVATTIWEIALKVSIGKLADIVAPGYGSIGAMLRAEGFTLVAFDDAMAEQAANLPRLHGDPFDRALVAAAQRLGATVLTNDSAIARYGVPVSW
jgi:PIN domain nuclease of toxin-antitoxin system